MTLYVVDASALGALLFGESKAEQIVETLGEGSLCAPSLLWFEMSSICLKKILAYPTKAEKITRAFSLLANFSIDAVEVDHGQVVQLAKDVGLSTYDASYLWLASQLNARLVTLDKGLLEAAGALGCV